MIQGIIVALIAAVIYMESRIGGQHMLDRPIIIGPLVGLAMGDFNAGLIIGGQLELVWMGLVGIGTSTPPDVVVGSALATALAIQTGADYQTTLALAIPIALLAQMVAIGVGILNTTFAHYADKQIEKGNWKGIAVGNWTGSLVYFLSKFLMVFIGFMVGGNAITAIVNNIPQVIQSGLGQSGNLLPALGIAMLMQLTFDKKYAAFLFLGFALVAFFDINTIGAAVMGAICAYIYYQFKPMEGELF
ncbi:PTS mannose/fructose/sorbose/N-acetylgalactosamine transporter subunit IIC [Jeotgalibaca ciconiae]|uniref:PTS sugar transporter subunit IIC n=1 Tax=Jeotgalibaca ciconiae TaxID=2496265 RepID=A0A3S9HBX0_9LACT|nr:PTS sugar transporter subunit IIC [Jeotgalibaca ciconiae]AZP04879.1 PTS sugar transporter subunit IIC [Jeotgalibaca ciconiae]